MEENKETPYLSIAAICERVLEEKDGALSGIRFIDTITLTKSKNAPNVLPPIPLQISALIAFKSGRARGKRTVRIDLYSPSGEKFSASDTQSILFKEDYQGANIIVRLALEATAEGIYWFSVVLEGEVITRMPLRVIIVKDQATDSETPKT